ncbi:glycosyltransferase family 2 protein [Xylanimonas ulmi]|uniref:Glycosyl transferase family 2 n=1 Tax=Xylanimonas ulmi TaxID=228973 RepID=A0A4Q7M063_9MICO|nr:glycosyltransferase family 2 protein [Xylanibacterium ulmi]RZS59932.1 hypothetical protein EV386_0169 [Xylanibacterium ulmi]
MAEVPAVDLVIASHDPRRRVGRAVASVLEGPQVRTRVTVVAHNTDVAGMEEAMRRDGVDVTELIARGSLRVLSLTDGVASPAGPFNLGLDRADAEFVAVMGSDDELEPGAVASWLALAGLAGAAAVIPRQRHASGVAITTPVARPGRTVGLDLVRDRLAYRSAPLGLVARAEVARLGLRFLEGVAVGEDIAFATRVWAEGSVAFDRNGPAYVVRDDAPFRVTTAPRPLRSEFAWLDAMLDDGWLTGLDRLRRAAVVTKFVRTHVFGAVLNRPDPAIWTDVERGALRHAAVRLIAVEPTAIEPLSVADRRLLDAMLDVTVPAGRLVGLAAARRHFGRPTTLVPRNPLWIAHREAPPRFMAASLLVR